MTPLAWGKPVPASEEAAVPRLLARFWNDQSGATAIEYALIAAGISLVIIVAVQGIGTRLNGRFAGINASLK
ncbi:Flp family type IVb pilin [Tardiphaga sp. vice352]|nr:Flp family type IVb pilin [Tardiphaga sp. vice154]QDM26768.1 Flp family type IVb pilin [Tardiphaga sp. vice304]QDM31831.1 Flp family type IVb pilin [Tardiphaga sp. vice352]